MNGTQIRNITAEGLTYLDENGSEAFIAFSICHQNYVRRLLDPHHLEQVKEMNRMNDEELQEFIEDQTEWKEVAYRNLCGDPMRPNPYVEFHTEPSIYFEFSTENDFYRVYGSIHRLGWRTFDLC